MEAVEDGRTEVRLTKISRSGSRTLCADDYDDRRRDVYESPADKLKAAIIKFGEVVSFGVILATCGQLNCAQGRPGGASST